MSTKTVLLVEDNPDEELLIMRALKSTGTTDNVDVAHDGIEAIDYFSTPANPDLPAFVLLDLKLPKVNGFEVLRHLRSDQRTALVPVVIFSSSAEDNDITRAYAYGANGYVRKQMDFNQLKETVSTVFKYWTSVNISVPDTKPGSYQAYSKVSGL